MTRTLFGAFDNEGSWEKESQEIRIGMFAEDLGRIRTADELLKNTTAFLLRSAEILQEPVIPEITPPPINRIDPRQN
jgi:hypothetical protein